MLACSAGEKPRAGDVALPEGTGQRAKEWAEGEMTKVRERKELAGQLSAAMQAHGHVPTPIREAMGG